MDYRDPNAPDLLTRQVAEIVRFDYTEEDWNKIEKSVRHLRPTQADLEYIRARLRHEARTYLLTVLDGPRHVAKQKWYTKQWAQIAKLSDQTLSLLIAVGNFEREEGPPSRDGRPAPDRYRKHKLAMTTLLDFARKRLDAPRIDHGYPEPSPRGWLQFHVLEIWTKLGGQLRISRHPRTKKITGPLARYFAAVTGPVPMYRGSLESLPDILDRQKSMAAALSKWRAEMAGVDLIIEKLRDKMPTEP